MIFYDLFRAFVVNRRNHQNQTSFIKIVSLINITRQCYSKFGEGPNRSSGLLRQLPLVPSYFSFFLFHFRGSKVVDEVHSRPVVEEKEKMKGLWAVHLGQDWVGFVTKQKVAAAKNHYKEQMKNLAGEEKTTLVDDWKGCMERVG
jgi:hypothetical protein